MAIRLRNVDVSEHTISVNKTMTDSGISIKKSNVTSYQVKKLRRSGIFAIISLMYTIALIIGLFQGEIDWAKGIGAFIIITIFSFLTQHYGEAWKIIINLPDKKYVFVSISEEEGKELSKLENAIKY